MPPIRPPAWRRALRSGVALIGSLTALLAARASTPPADFSPPPTSLAPADLIPLKTPPTASAPGAPAGEVLSPFDFPLVPPPAEAHFDTRLTAVTWTSNLADLTMDRELLIDLNPAPAENAGDRHRIVSRLTPEAPSPSSYILTGAVLLTLLVITRTRREKRRPMAEHRTSALNIP